MQALQKISEDYLPRDEATFLVFNVVQLLTKKSDQIENAKIAVIMLMEKFSTIGFFDKKECAHFLDTCFDKFKKDAMFKIKKQLVPCMLAITKHIDYEVFLTRVAPVYFQFANDGIWGVRRVSIELLP